MDPKTVTFTSGSHSLIITEPGEYLVELVEPNTVVEIKGAFSVKAKEEVAVTIIINHKAPHTRANTTLRGVARDQGFLKFTGRIIIEKDCGDTNSFLTERVLLLSDQARAETIPDLEIKTDDVKCSHAASISRIPEEHLFYLMSRGLSQLEAETVIIEGFLDV